MALLEQPRLVGTRRAPATVVLAAEKNSRASVGITTVVGILLVRLGLAVVVHPSVLTALASTTNTRMS